MDITKTAMLAVFFLGLTTTLLCPWQLTFSGKLKGVTAEKSFRRLSAVIIYRNDLTRLRRMTAAIISRFGKGVQIIVVTTSALPSLISLCDNYKLKLIYCETNANDFSLYYAGAKEAKNDALLFTDSDTFLSRDVFDKLFKLLSFRCVVSVVPKVNTPMFSLKTAVFTLFALMSSGLFCVKKTALPSLYPHCMLIDRHDYFNICTHDMVGAKPRASSALACAYIRAGLKVISVSGEELITSHGEAYKKSDLPTSLWGKFAACAYFFGALAVFFVMLFTCLFSFPSFAFVWLYVVCAFVFTVYMRRFTSASILLCALYPLYMLTFAFNAIIGAIRRLTGINKAEKLVSEHS